MKWKKFFLILLAMHMPVLAHETEQLEAEQSEKIRAFMGCRVVGHDINTPGLDALIRKKLENIMGKEQLNDVLAKYNTDTSRWPGTEGEPITLTWSFVPDNGASNLFATMNGVFPSQSAWIQRFEDGFNRWGYLTGITFQRVIFDNEADDGAPEGSPGLAGVRGDIRIFGENQGPVTPTIPGGVAITFLPGTGSEGDMFFNTNSTINWASPWWNPFFGFDRTIHHEIGHAVGINHVCPDNDTMLMQPSATSSFSVWGAQHDDVRVGQKLYGDPYEPNDTKEDATWVALPMGSGTLNLGEVSTYGGPYGPVPGGRISIDRTGDEDWFRVYTFQDAKVITQLTLRPVGHNYENWPAPVGQLCPSGTGSFTDSARIATLSVEVTDWQGQLLATKTGSLGNPIYLYYLQMPYLDAPYYVRVYVNGAVAEPQLYDLELFYNPNNNCTTDNDCTTIDPCFGYGYCNGGSSCSLWVTNDCDYNFVEDSCQPDCDGDGIPDTCEPDCNGNGIPDDCDIDQCNGAAWCSDVNNNNIPDGCEPDCNGNGIPDDWDISQGTAVDANGDSVPDSCSQTWRVPADYPDLRTAVMNAEDGDTILVAAGTYTGTNNKNINIDKHLTIESEDGPFNTVIDMEGSGRAFLIAELNQTNIVKIEGFTFVNGYADENIDFGGNGGAIASWQSQLTIWRCIFDRNEATYSGGALYIEGGNSELVQVNTSIFSNNLASVGGGIYIRENVYPNIINCTIVKNNATGSGSGIMHQDNNDGFALINSLVWNNRPNNDQIVGSSVINTSSRVPTYYLAINPGSGSTDNAPKFVAPASDNYHLQSTSKMIDAGSYLYVPPPGLTDIDGQRRRRNTSIDIGADEATPTVIIINPIPVPATPTSPTPVP